jgi:hypothetical protein
MCRLKELASMFCASMAHCPPSLPAVFGHELPGYLAICYLAPSSDMSRLHPGGWSGTMTLATIKTASHRCHA